MNVFPEDFLPITSKTELLPVKRLGVYLGVYEIMESRELLRESIFSLSEEENTVGVTNRKYSFGT